MRPLKFFVLLCLIQALLMGITYNTQRIAEVEQTEEHIQIKPAHAIQKNDKEAEWICQTNRKISPEEAKEIAYQIREIMRIYENDEAYFKATKKVNARVMLGLIATESKFNKKAKGSSGEIGLTQIIPRYHSKRLKTAGIIKQDKELWQVRNNVKSGAYILLHEAKRSRTVREALSRYNAGCICEQGLQYAERVLKAKGDCDRYVASKSFD